MELTLNLVWACLAAVAVFVQIVTLSREAMPSERPVSNCRKIVAMGCTLVILFFVISMTDDLHDQALLLEERKVSRIAHGTKTSARSSPDRLTSIEFLLFFSPAVAPSLPEVRGLLAPSEFLVVAAIDLEGLSGRAPPVSLA